MIAKRTIIAATQNIVVARLYYLRNVQHKVAYFEIITKL